MPNQTAFIVLIAAVVGFSSAHLRANILQSTQNTTVDSNATIYGQTLTADSSVANLTNFNFVISSNAAGVTATAKLFAGAGYAGSPLDTKTRTFSSIVPLNSPLSFNFTGNTLVPGNVYTVQVVSDASTARR